MHEGLTSSITRLRYFSYDADGHILTRRDGTLNAGSFTETANSRQHYAYADGQQVATLGEDGTIDAATQLTAFDSSDLGTEPALVLEGDTLQSIAQRVYGNGNLWYVLAAANAVTDADLVAGTTLKAPAVKTTANDANTFKPYDPSKIEGPTTPSLPYISPPSQHGCDAMAMVVRLFVAVAVAFGQVYVAAAYATIGEAAAQSVEIQDGYREGYDWGQVALSGLTAGVGGGAAKEGFGAAFVQGAKQAAISNLAGYALHKALGEEAHFSLRGLVSDTLAGGIAESVLGPAMTLNGTAVGGNIASSAGFSWTAVAAAAKSVLRQGISYGVHQAIEGHATWNNGQVLVNAATDAAVAMVGKVRTDAAAVVANMSVEVQRQRDAEARQFYDAAWADGNPFNGAPGNVTADSTTPSMADGASPSTSSAVQLVQGERYANDPDYQYLASQGGYARVEDLNKFTGQVHDWSTYYSKTYSIPTIESYLAVGDGTDPYASYFAYNNEVAKPFTQFQVEFNSDPGRVEAAWSIYREQLAANAQLAEMISPSPQPFSVASYDAFQAQLAASDWRAAKAFGGGVLQGALNSAALFYQEATDDTAYVMRDGKLSHKTQADYWVPFPGAPTSGSQAAGRVAGAVALGVIPANAAGELAALPRMAESSRIGGASALEVVANSAPARLTFQPSSGVVLEATPGKTTTILGNYSQDMKAIVNELGNVKSTDFGPRTGGFNVLNVPDELYVTPKQFWVEYNQPWLSNAVTRDDPILMATQPKFGPTSKLFRLNDATGKLELSGFGKEYLYLRQSGLRYDPVTKQMVRSP